MSKKDKIQHVQNKLDYYIGNYVWDKQETRKARQYSMGIRTNSDYKYLEDNFGIGTPASLKFYPLITLRMNILKGILLSKELKSQVTAVDDYTIKKEQEERSARNHKKSKEIFNSLMSAKSEEEFADSHKKIEGQYAEKVDSSFQSAAQHIVNFILNSSDFDIQDKLEKIFDEFLIANEYAIRKLPNVKNTIPMVEVCPSEDFFFMKGKSSNDIQDSDAVVYRRYMTKRQVIMELGGYMSRTEKEEFLKDNDIILGANNSYIKDYNISRYGYDSYFMDVSLYDAYYRNLNDVVEVYHVQYKEAETISREPITFDEKLMAFVSGKKKREDSIEQLYEGYRVGVKYYLGLGKKVYPDRDYKDYRRVRFDYQGASYNNFRSKVNSVVANTIDIQDMIDIMIFHRENLTALSGVRGSRVNIAAIPKAFGANLMDRLKVFKALKKNGDEYYDFTQPGAELFQQAGDFNNSLDGNAVLALNSIVQLLEQEADSVFGINPEMRGQIEQREAVSNVRAGIKFISYATKKYYTYTDSALENILFMLLDGIKKSYPDGYSGVYYIGESREIFKVSPQWYSVSTFIVSIKSEDSDIIDMEKLRAAIREFASAGLVKPELAIMGATMTSRQEIHDLALRGLKEREADGSEIQKMKEYIGQMEQQMGQLQKQSEASAKEVEQWRKRNLDILEKKLELEKMKITGDTNTANKELITKEKIETRKLDEISRRTNLEREQIYAENGTAKEVKNI